MHIATVGVVTVTMDDLSIPIDIHFNKLLDWLIDRRHCDVRWHHQLRQIREKVSQSLSGLPKGTPAELLELKDEEIVEVTFFDCQKIMEYLLSVESTDTNILRQYTSPRLKEWNDILKLYEKKNVYLAEGAQALTRQVNYEIASLKKQLGKCQQQQRECSRRASDYQQSAANHKEQFKERCRELGIEGNDVTSELVQLVNDLPALFEEMASLFLQSAPSVQYYKAFCSSVNKRSVPEEDIVPLLTYVINHGNTTVYQYKHGEPPEKPTNNSNNNGDTVRQGEEPTDSVQRSDVIDWGNLEEEEEIQTQQKQQQQQQQQQEEGKAVQGEGEIDVGDEQIDFDLSIDDFDVSEIVIEGSGEAETEARTEGQVFVKKSQYPTILEDFQCRNALMNDIMEVYEFLRQRNVELTSAESGILQVSTQLPETLQVHSSEDLVSMISAVSLVIEKMTNKRTQQLLLMLDSQSYLERLSSQLLHQNNLSQQFSRQIDDYVLKAEEASFQQSKLEEQLRKRVRRTKELQKQIVGEISKKYKNRKVNLTGEINQIG